MTDRTPCDGVVDRLDAALLSRRAPDASDLSHADGCSACGAHLAALRDALGALDAARVAPLDPERARAIRLRVARELASDHAARALAPRPAALPDGYLREVARILGWAALPLPLVVLGYLELFRLGAALLGRWLPEAAVLTIGALAALGAASWLAAVYGSIPFVAQRRMAARGATGHFEVNP